MRSRWTVFRAVLLKGTDARWNSTPADWTEYPNTVKKMKFQSESQVKSYQTEQNSFYPAEEIFPNHTDWPSYSQEVKQWTCSSASCWLLMWPNTQSSTEKSSLEGNTTTQKWNLLAVNKNRKNRGAGIVSHGNSNERELDMQERKRHNINFPSHSMYSPVSLYTILGDEHKKAEEASEWIRVPLSLMCLHLLNTAALLLITAH